MSGRFKLDDTATGPVRLTGMDTRRGVRQPGAATLIKNFNVGLDGLLRGIVGPAPLCVDAQTGVPATYGSLYGIFVGELQGLETLLIYEGGAIKRYTPWLGGSSWQTLESGFVSSSTLAPAQFLRAGDGVVILPQSVDGAVPRFYDGLYYGYLGYPEIPPAPEPIGPANRNQTSTGVPYYEGHNAAGVARMAGDINRMYDTSGAVVQTRYRFYRYGYGAIGTTESNPASTDAEGEDAGSLQAGEWMATVQFINRWGHISAPSALSSPQQLSFRRPISGATSLDDLLQNFYWRIPTGPANTVGRIISRTKDTRNTGGGSQTYELRGNAGSTGLASFASAPDNASTLYYDNFSDGSLLTPSVNTIPTPSATVMTFAFGRLWLGTRDGRIYYSKQGNVGTFLRDEFVVASGRVTGFALTPDGLIAFTETEAMIIIERPEAAAFTTRKLVSGEGCSAPDSIRTMPDGTVVWLAPRGFVAYAQGATVFVGAPIVTDWIEHKETVKNAAAVVHPTSGTYICWVSTRRGRIGFQLDPAFGWSLRTDVEAFSAVPWDDTILAVGLRVDDDTKGIWCLDRRQYKSQKDGYVGNLDYVIETWEQNQQEMSATSMWHLEAETFCNTAQTVTVSTLSNGRGSPTQNNSLTEVATYNNDNGGTNGYWGSFYWSAEEYWDKEMQSVVNAPLSAHGVRSARVRIQSTEPPTFGWLSISYNRGGGGR